MTPMTLIAKEIAKEHWLKFLPYRVLYSLVLIPCFVFGHAGENHEDPGIVVEDAALEKSDPVLPINVGGSFSLIDHNNNVVTDQSFAGKHMLVFFGYTNCQIMCSISLTRIGDALKLLESEKKDLLATLAPLVVTVDPQNDTPATLKESLASYHPGLLGLTGTPGNLEQMYEAYNQSPKVLEAPLNGEDVVSHSSYFYLMGPDGTLKTLFPPILNAESMANIIRKYIAQT